MKEQSTLLHDAAIARRVLPRLVSETTGASVNPQFQEVVQYEPIR